MSPPSVAHWHCCLRIDAGAVIGGINQRKGTIVDTEIRDEEFTLTAEVSLNDMFGCESQSPFPLAALGVSTTPRRLLVLISPL